MVRAYVCAAALFCAATAQADDSVTVSKLKAGQQLEIYTQDVTYRATLIAPETGECRMQVGDGSRFSSPRTVFLIGATKGQQDGLSLVKMGELKVGFKIELGLDDLTEVNRAHTTSVTKVELR